MSAARIVKAAGLSRLSMLEPPEPPNRYERAYPGDMVHVDIKKLARFDAPGHRVTHTRAGGCSAGAGYDYLFVAVDDYNRASFVGIYPDETNLEGVCRTMRSMGYPVQRLLTDNGRCFTSDLAPQVCARYAVPHRTTRPYRPRTNGKAERFIQTLLREWACAATYANSSERKAALWERLAWYNEQRPHALLDGCPPVQRLPNVLRNDS